MDYGDKDSPEDADRDDSGSAGGFDSEQNKQEQFQVGGGSHLAFVAVYAGVSSAPWLSLLSTRSTPRPSARSSWKPWTAPLVGCRSWTPWKK